MKFVVAILALSAVAIAMPADVRSRASVTTFEAFKAKFNKKYVSPQEEAMREANFRASQARVAQKNADHIANGGEAVFGITKFADMSPQEFRNKYLKYEPKASAFRDRALRSNVQPELPVPKAGLSCLTGTTNTTCDWRRASAVSPVKDQQQCGSCWAFSATEEIESMSFMKHGEMPILAPQQIVSCDTVDQGCNGGDTPTAYQYVMQAGGLDTEANYPYTSGGGDSGNCIFPQGSVAAKISGFTYACPPCNDQCNNQNEALLAANMVKTGPVSVCLNAEPWQDYNGGILSSGCAHDVNSMDHCVQLVGYNLGGSTPYWILRNSWNTDWGLEGYIYVARANNLCGVANEATFVQAI